MPFGFQRIPGVVPGEDDESLSAVTDDDGPVLAVAADGLADLGGVAAAGVAGEALEVTDPDVPRPGECDGHPAPPAALRPRARAVPPGAGQ